ncbi:MAG: class I SAM-dependent methyltransferase [Deltaproteobacteria bacterium]|jgi:ubiquinone/menaquinone biosynthesis C-methylase UbiE|nr:class I SAM-dependent methyltransferase [Deltaproteobacteria bacterium]
MFRGKKSTIKTQKPLRILSNDSSYNDEHVISSQIAKFNELINGKGHWHQKMLKMKALIGSLRGKKALDLGTQIGTYALCLSKESRITVGIDFANMPLKKAIELREQLNHTNAYFVQGNVKALPLVDESFDVVIACDIIEYLVDEDLEYMLRESHRTLKDGGNLVLQTYPNKYAYCFMEFKKCSVIPILLFWLPRDLYSKAIGTYHRGVMLARRLKWKITGQCPKDTHINCQTLESISEFVKSAGFKIEVAFAENTYSNYERTAFGKFMGEFLGNNIVTKQNIYLRAEKVQ